MRTYEREVAAWTRKRGSLDKLIIDDNQGISLAIKCMDGKTK